MKTIASRMLTAAPGKVWAELEREGALVVTKDGVPRSIMIPTSDATLFEDIGEIVFARARPPGGARDADTILPKRRGGRYARRPRAGDKSRTADTETKSAAWLRSLSGCWIPTSS